MDIKRFKNFVKSYDPMFQERLSTIAYENWSDDTIEEIISSTLDAYLNWAPNKLRSLAEKLNQVADDYERAVYDMGDGIQGDIKDIMAYVQGGYFEEGDDWAVTLTCVLEAMS